MKRVQLAVVLVGLLFAVGCEKDVREPGEPRISVPAATPYTNGATRSNAATSGLAYASPNRWTWFNNE
jgi:hypothetical protein